MPSMEHNGKHHWFTLLHIIAHWCSGAHWCTLVHLINGYLERTLCSSVWRKYIRPCKYKYKYLVHIGALDQWISRAHTLQLSMAQGAGAVMHTRLGLRRPASHQNCPLYMCSAHISGTSIYLRTKSTVSHFINYLI